MGTMAKEIESFPLYEISQSSLAEKPSLLYGLLPKVVQTRMRKIPSLRRSISQYAIGAIDVSPANSRRSSTVYSELPTPPPGYQSRVSLSEPGSDAEDLGETFPIRPLPNGFAPDSTDTTSGINWRFSSQGLSLIRIAAQEQSKDTEVSRRNSTSLSRQLYVHGLTYLLRGLPTDLSAEEKITVWSAVPPDVQQLSPVLTSTSAAEVSASRTKRTTKAEHPSILHQAVAIAIVQFFILSQFLLPYIRTYFGILYRYERQHKISEKMIASGIHSCEGVMNTGVQITNHIYHMNGGKVGKAVNEAAAWWVKGVTGGIHQGVGDGLVVLGLEAASIPSASGEACK